MSSNDSNFEINIHFFQIIKIEKFAANFPTFPVDGEYFFLGCCRLLMYRAVSSYAWWLESREAQECREKIHFPRQ